MNTAKEKEAGTLDVALDYVAKHKGQRFIFPIRNGCKYPPLIKDNLDQASNDPAQLTKWSKRWPSCNWGLSHQKSGVLVADIDKNAAKGKKGQATFDDLDLFYGWPETETTTTPNGGEHRIHIGEHITAFGVHGFGLDVDSPNYTLLPGCALEDGGKYVSNGVEAVAAEPWMYSVIAAAKSKSSATRAEGFEDPIDVALFKQMLDATPYRGGPTGLDDRNSQEGWFNFMAAVHEASGGDNGEYRDLFIEWSLNDPETQESWTAETITPRWESLNAKREGGITRASWEKVLLFFKCDDLVSSSQGGDIPTDDFADDPPEPPIARIGVYNIKTGKYEFRAPPEADDFEYGTRPGINVTKIDGNLPLLSRKVQKGFVKAVAKADAKAADQVFDRGGALAHLSRNRLTPGTEAKFDKNFHVENELLIVAAQPEWFADTLERTFTFFRRTVKKDKSKKVTPCGAPQALVKRMFAISQDWQYPKIMGTVETPTLRLDGTVLDKPGYDKKSGLYFDPGAMNFPPIKENPSKADALAALAILKNPLIDFPFADEDGVAGLSRSVALAMLLTAVCRRVLPTAPMFGIDANEANTGKTQLAQVAAILMTGRETAARPGLPHDGYQLQNALAAAFEAGDAMILYDNIDGDKQTVEGDALCAALTSEMMQCRRLGGNSAADQIKARTNSLIAGTGNKLTFSGDMSKVRALICNLRTDKALSDRTFAHWPLDNYVISMRAALVSAALTVLRAYQVTDDKKPGPNFRFPEWRSIVADALVWLGEADPVQSTERVKDEDPVEAAQRDVMRAWAKCIGEADVTTTEVMLRPDVRKAIAEARAVPEHKLTTDSAAKFLKGMVGIKLLGYRLAKWMPRDNVAHWQATCVDEAALVTVRSPQTAEDPEQAERDFGFADEVEDLM
jgi:hypothetical protein